MKIQKAFFSRKNLLLISVTILLIYGILLGWMAVQFNNERRSASQEAQAEADRFNQLSDAEKAIAKAQKHLMDSIAIVKPPERIFLSYLQRKFELPDNLGTNGSPIDLYENPRTYPEEIHYLARIAYPERIVNIPPGELDENIKITNIYSANCDHLQLPANFWQVMEVNVLNGGYYAAHVALALTFMQDNDCALPAGAEAMDKQVTEVMANLADNPDTDADLRYEAIAFLMMRERHELIKPLWIEQIVSEQNSGGGWSQNAQDDKIDYHSTLLAFWALLEYSHQDTKDVPMILRPTEP